MRFADADHDHLTTGNAGMIILFTGVGILVAVALVVVVLFRHRFVVVQVFGHSMLPTLRPGERVLVRRAPAARLTVGTVAVVRSRASAPAQIRSSAPSARWVIKRVAAVPGDLVPESVRTAAGGMTVVPEGKLVLLSDNPTGTDSRRWGLVPGSDLLGTVVSRLPARGSPAVGSALIARSRRTR